MLLGNSDLPTDSTLLVNTVKFEIILSRGFYSKTLIMPGHNHSIVRRMIPGDLNSTDALWLWNCSIIHEGLDIWIHIKE